MWNRWILLQHYAGPPQGHLPDRGRGGLHRVLAPRQGRGRGPAGGQLRQAGEEAAAAGEAGQGVGQPRVGPVEARHHGGQVHRAPALNLDTVISQTLAYSRVKQINIRYSKCVYFVYNTIIPE